MHYLMLKSVKGVCSALPEYMYPHITLSIIVEPMPFTRWGTDILGPLPLVIRQKKFLFVAVDYFAT